MSQPPTDPQSDADRIRLKRLAKLQASTPIPSTSEQSSATASTSGTPQRTESPKSAQIPQAASPKPSPAPVKRPVEEVPAPFPLKKKTTAQPENLDISSWAHETIGNVLGVALEKDVAEKSGFQIVWLKPLAVELVSEGLPQPIRLTSDIMDRALIARLEVDPQSMSDDLEYVSVLASLPASQTVFEYLVGCWKRLNNATSALTKRKYPPMEVQQATEVLDKLRDLVISYAGLSLQEPEMFPQPQDRALGPPELIGPLLSLSALSAPLLSSSQTGALALNEVQPFLQDLARRFADPDELRDVLSGVVRQLLYHPSLAQREGLAGADAGWRRVLAGLEALAGIKGFAEVITGMPEWCPEHATAANIELVSLMGPLLRLGAIQRDWPYIAQTYFSEVEKRSQADVDSSFASLRGTLKSLQGTLFQVFNALVRAGPGPREAVLKYFARIIALNVKRSGLQVEQETVASDSFMLNIQAILLRFAEPFMDSKYSKIDRVDPLYFVHSDRIDAKEETRIKATAQEAADFAKEQEKGPATNFISDIFFLTCAMGHLGVQQTINRYEDSLKHYDEIRQHLDQLQADNSWMGTPMQARAEAAITNIKGQQSKLGSVQFAFRTSLEDPEFVFRSLTFANFVSTWILRFVDPKKTHPSPNLELPLPKEVPMSFRTLPEYIFEDVVETTLFYARYSPSSLALAGKNEIVVFALTFLTSTWYIKNPFLKSKLIEILYSGVSTRGPERDRGPLGPILHENAIALKHLMAALMHFYVEVEQTGASSQFYDKFSSRRLMAFLFKYIWNNPVHREALNAEAKKEDDKFVRFANLMISDVTYLMDESLSDMSQIHAIQTEMADKVAWEAQTPEYRQEKEKSLRQLERMASGYCDLSKSTVALLQTFTTETRAPFMMPEVVNKLAAMLDYNLDALVGPRCQDLKVKDPSKYRFDPRQLLKDILQVYLNLAGEEPFVRAVAGDGRSYKKELFEKAMGIAKRRALKTDPEIEQVRLFVVRVEEMKATIEAEEDLGEIPDEFTDPLMATIMRDPVILPTSRTVLDRSTIKSYLLSETRDPFNRQPLAIEDVIPDVELKAKIDAFLAERRNKRTALDMPEGDIVKMDMDAREPDGMKEKDTMEE